MYLNTTVMALKSTDLWNRLQIWHLKSNMTPFRGSNYSYKCKGSQISIFKNMTIIRLKLINLAIKLQICHGKII